VPLDFEVDIGVLNNCGGFWSVTVRVQNTGPETLESIKIESEDTATSTQLNNQGDGFGLSGGCILLGLGAIAPGGEGFFNIGNYGYDPFGNTIQADVTMCTQDGLAGKCRTKSFSGTAAGISDVDQKEEIEPVQVAEVLERLLELPIHRWSYQYEGEDIRHLGPMAQDFYAAFGLGGDDRTINGIDSNGVALAAIQGLYEQVQARDDQIRSLEARINTLERSQAAVMLLTTFGIFVLGVCMGIFLLRWVHHRIGA
jgi:hypothetical protein